MSTCNLNRLIIMKDSGLGALHTRRLCPLRCWDFVHERVWHGGRGTGASYSKGLRAFAPAEMGSSYTSGLSPPDTPGTPHAGGSPSRLLLMFPRSGVSLPRLMQPGLLPEDVAGTVLSGAQLPSVQGAWC